MKSKYIFDAHKPSTENYRKAMELMRTTPKNTLFLGDQIFTDIWGANRAGVQTVMLKKIDKKEEIQIVLKRIPEKFVLWRWRKKLQKHSKNLEIVYKKEQPTLKKVLHDSRRPLEDVSSIAVTDS
ncbi:MAG: HAD hydrolase-like protein [Eubacterium ventriosum]